MAKLTINGQEVEFEPGMTVLQAAELAGIEVPVFCYHPKLTIAGNCRMCLVEVEKSPKPVASCALPAADGMVVRTDTPYVEKARKGVLEFLLINHPLDCPICDQGGECDLQDITLNYGASLGRYHENKRAVKDKYFGPLIKTFMTRCIHCTRCVRFGTEIAGVQELGGTGRGENMEIGTYVEKALSSELSGNMIDICPVGALTSKPYSFQGRPWELTKTESIDVFDAVGSNIRIDSRDREVMRILPRQNDAVNEEWLADKARFSYDALKSQRLDRPYVRNKQGKLEEASWEAALSLVAEKISETSPEAVAAVVGDMMECEGIFLLKELLDKLSIPNRDCRLDGSNYSLRTRGDYLFNPTIAGIEEADVCLLIGSNPRWEAPLLNARLRKRYFNQGLKMAVIGAPFEPTFPCTFLGEDPALLKDILNGKHVFASVLKSAKRPLILVGASALSREDGDVIHDYARAIAHTYNAVHADWNGFGVLHHAASRVGALELGFLPSAGGKGTREIFAGCEKGEIKVLYLLGADEVPESALKKGFVIYQGHHGDKAAAHANVILPGCAYTEKSGLYINLEGRVQRAFRAVFGPGEAREDWKIIRMLFEKLGLPSSYRDLNDVRAALAQHYPIFQSEGIPAQEVTISNAPKKFGALQDTPLEPFFKNYYMTDAISRHSVTMARCIQEIDAAYSQASPRRAG